MSQVATKRVYEPADDGDGYRVLVDRLWPRGITRERAHLDEWLKDVAPTPALRTWWNHDPGRMDDFTLRYDAELESNIDAVTHLLQILQDHDLVTLVYAAHDPLINHAVVLQRFLERQDR